MIRGSRHDQNTQYGIFKGIIQIILKPTTETKTSYKISLDEVGCLQSDMTIKNKYLLSSHQWIIYNLSPPKQNAGNRGKWEESP